MKVINHLFEHGAKLNIRDSDGRDPIMHAVILNNTELLKSMLRMKEKAEIDTNGQDYAGKSAVHYVINPIKFGSYENTDILRLLHKNEFNFNL